MTQQANESVLRLDLFYIFYAVVATITLLALRWGAASHEELWPLIGIFCGTASLLVIGSLRLLGLSWVSGPILYLSYLWVFHFPFLFLASLYPALLDLQPTFIQQWTLTGTWYEAGLFAVLCVTAFAVGTASTLNARYSRIEHAETERPPWNDDLLWRLGLIETVVGSGMVLYAIMRSGGAVVFTKSYGSLFDDLFASKAYIYGTMLATQGFLFAALGAFRRTVNLILVYLVVFTSVMLLLGARTAGLAPVVLLVVALHKRGIRISRWLIVVGFVPLLWTISFVGAAREKGVLGSGQDVASTAGPVGALMELGGSLETASLSFQWIKGGDRLLLGGGYWLPFERAIGFLIPGVRQDITYDPRAMSEILTSRTHGLGGSGVAESYYNFGLSGAMIFFLPLGYLIGRLDWADTPRSTAWFVSILFPLMIDVRNWFLSVPAMIFVAVLPLVVIELIRPSPGPAATGRRGWMQSDPPLHITSLLKSEGQQ